MTGLVEVFDQISDTTDQDAESVTMGAILDHVGNRSLGPLLMIPALIAIGPTGAIPGVAVLCGSLILLVSVQLFTPGTTPWLPRRLRQFEIDRGRLSKVLGAVRPWARRIDRVMHERLLALSGRAGQYASGLCCAILALTIFPLALLPFAVAIPASAILLFGVGLTTRDGVVVAAGFLIAGLSFGFAIWALV